MSKKDSPPYQYRLSDLFLVIIAIAIWFAIAGAEAIRTGIPTVLILWTAIRQWNMNRLTWVNPCTVGLVSGFVCYPLFEIVTSRGMNPQTAWHLVETAFIGAGYSLFRSFFVVLYFTMAGAIYETVRRRKSENRREFTSSSSTPALVKVDAARGGHSSL